VTDPGTDHVQPSNDGKRGDARVEERSLLTSIVAHIPSGVFWKGRDFKYQGCNQAFAYSAGVGRAEDIVGKTDYELVWEKEQADYFRACDRQVMEEDRPLLNIEEVERQADGRQAILLTSKVDADVLGKALQLDVFGVIGKPVNLDILQELLHRLFLKRYNSDLFALR